MGGIQKLTDKHYSSINSRIRGLALDHGGRPATKYAPENYQEMHHFNSVPQK